MKKLIKAMTVIVTIAMLLGAVACSVGDADDDEHIANTASTTTSSISSSSSTDNTSDSDNSGEDTNTEAESDTEGTEKGDDTDSTDETGEDTSSDTSDDTTAVESVSEGMILVTGATITGTEEISPTSYVFIPGRSFTIGDFYICDHEVTQAEYEEYCTFNGTYTPYTGSSSGKKYGVGTNYPAYYVSWYDALVYCNLRSMAEELTPCYTINSSTDPEYWGDIPTSSDSSTKSTWDAVECNFNANGYRLPTEAEWEYAARGGNGLTGTQYTYAGSNTIDDVAWYSDNSDSTAHEVGKKQANELGLYDMSGNVREWCYDWCSRSISSDTASTGPSSGSQRVLRGGSWNLTVSDTTVSWRGSNYPYNRGGQRGFRVARTAK